MIIEWNDPHLKNTRMNNISMEYNIKSIFLLTSDKIQGKVQYINIRSIGQAWPLYTASF